MVRYRSVVDLPTHWHFYYENIILLVMIYICLGQNMLRFFFMNKEKTVSKLRKVTIRKNHLKRSTWYLSENMLLKCSFFFKAF